jgi:peptidyl-prolyl cis-trans isomerase A (cyclophilin A)
MTTDDLGLLLGGVVAALVGLGGHGGSPDDLTGCCPISTGAGHLHADVAPLAVANFIGLARGLRPFLDPTSNSWITRPYYDGLTFHRAHERQFVQGGRLGETGQIGFRLQDEPSVGSAFDRTGVLALANQGQPQTSAGEFFITTNVLREFDGKYTIIGDCDDPLIVRALEARVLADERPVIETVTITRE